MGVLYLFVRDGKVFIPPSFWKVSWFSAGGSSGVRLSLSRLSVCVLALWSLGAIIFYELEQEYTCEDAGETFKSARECTKKVKLFDAFYFVFITLTTIGYGDVVPSSVYSRLFVLVFTLLGLGLFSTFLDVMGAWRTSMLQQLKQSASFGDFLEATIVLLVVLGAGTMGLSWIEDLELVDALYLCVTTVTTVGYGDLKPVTFWGRVFVIMLAITIGYVTSCIGDLIQPDSDTAIGFGGDETQWNLSFLDRFFGRKLIGLSVMRYFEPHMSFTDCFYWSVMTFTTIGYGDFAPLSTGGKVIELTNQLNMSTGVDELDCCLLACLSISVVGFVSSTIGDLIQETLCADWRKVKDSDKKD
ncbi:hypothetical protein GUITHDRAFT_109021 [Guillardia theta CCMP2712]|uniref:Potassium channel domain-containing protein n=1 Tax=Guillardia theta (strain CCMP2712) TaxID=905079 RepID=L1JA60_GUITC|nr:hypothetical protein GUITHDRAFT_109021 [Guillardia theta CCMP2712]EKX44975.1 hypothetical protein GUITHDRAFT_109021 [Guillardia theta CCMP2712]|eukprot:XP_005831955.1 hypothetical protein GUITHDRAFT_109021 [Guillardia theta CCMP2712]